MAEFNTEFNVEDWETVNDALCQWESSEDGFIDFCKKLNMIGDPPQEFIDEAPSEFGDWWNSFRREMKTRMQKAKDRRKQRMERACLLKTKVILKKNETMDALSDELFHGMDSTGAQMETPDEADEVKGAKEEEKDDESGDDVTKED